MPRGGFSMSPAAGGPAVAPQGGMFNAWPTMLGGPQSATGLPGPGGAAPALGAPQPSQGIGGLGAAFGNMMKGGLAANAFGLFGSPQGADVKEQIRQQFIQAGRPDPFAPPAPQPQAQIPNLTNAQYPIQPTMTATPVPMPQPRPQMPPQISMPQDPQQPQPSPLSFFGGPGSMSFGAGEGPSGNNYGNQGILAALFNR